MALKLLTMVLIHSLVYSLSHSENMFIKKPGKLTYYGTNLGKRCVENPEDCLGECIARPGCNSFNVIGASCGGTNQQYRCRFLPVTDFNVSLDYSHIHSTSKVYFTRISSASKNVSLQFINDVPEAKSCQDIYDISLKKSGIYLIFRFSKDGKKIFHRVLCDMDTLGGAWTVIQQNHGQNNFNRDWNRYKNGFGNLQESFWLGNEKIRQLTKKNDQELLIEVEDFDGKKGYALYKNFSVANESGDFQLSIGDAGSLSGVESPLSGLFEHHSGKPFTTRDRNNDEGNSNCTVIRHWGWWFNDNCKPHVFLNGRVNSHGGEACNANTDSHIRNEDSVICMKKSRMMIRKMKTS